jgi:hypothetical protein
MLKNSVVAVRENNPRGFSLVKITNQTKTNITTIGPK